MKENDINSDSVQRPKPLKKLVKVKNNDKKAENTSQAENDSSGKVTVLSKNSVRGKYEAKPKLTYNREAVTSPIEWKDYHGKHMADSKQKSANSSKTYIGKHETPSPEQVKAAREAQKAAIAKRTLVKTDKIKSNTQKIPPVVSETKANSEPEDSFESEPFVFNLYFSQPDKKVKEPVVEEVTEKTEEQPVEEKFKNKFVIEETIEVKSSSENTEPDVQPLKETPVPVIEEEPKQEEYVYEQKTKSWKDILIKVGAIVASIVIVCGLVLNMPILKDSKTDKRVSIMYMFKHWQPLVENEGELEENTMELNVDPEKSLPDFTDGLDLPQIIEGQFSVLFLGFDEEVYNTDVMWVVQFDIGHAGINILQIPRDCFVPSYTTSYTGKMNSVYSAGDSYILPPIQRVVNAVQDNFGIPIDAYVTTTCFDIVDMVDLIGGIPIHIENEIIYEADKIIPEGDITLTGQQAEWFVRFRREWLQGDIGRVQNQRRFMAAAMQKLLSIVKDEGRLKLYSYMKQIYNNEYIYTDLSLENISMLADFASTLSMENIQVNMIPGEDAEYIAYDGEKYDVYSIHKQETIDMLNNYFRPYQRAMTEWDTEITELVEYHSYSIYDDTGTNLEELQDATEPLRDPSKKPEWSD